MTAHQSRILLSLGLICIIQLALAQFTTGLAEPFTPMIGTSLQINATTASATKVPPEQTIVGNTVDSPDAVSHTGIPSIAHLGLFLIETDHRCRRQLGHYRFYRPGFPRTDTNTIRAYNTQQRRSACGILANP